MDGGRNAQDRRGKNGVTAVRVGIPLPDNVHETGVRNHVVARLQRAHYYGFM